MTKKATTAKKTTAKKPAAKKQVPWMTKTTNRFKKLKDEDVQALTKTQQTQYAKALEKYEAEKEMCIRDSYNIGYCTAAPGVAEPMNKKGLQLWPKKSN